MVLAMLSICIPKHTTEVLGGTNFCLKSGGLACLVISGKSESTIYF